VVVSAAVARSSKITPSGTLTTRTVAKCSQTPSKAGFFWFAVSFLGALLEIPWYKALTALYAFTLA